MSRSDLSVVPPNQPAAKASIANIVRLGLVLTVEGRNLPFELAFCSSESGKDSECFLVKAGARSAVCYHCKERHEVIGLVEAIEERGIALGGDDGPWPIIMPELLLGPMFREIQKGNIDSGASLRASS